MPQITIQNISNKTVTFQDLSKTVLKIFQEARLDWICLRRQRPMYHLKMIMPGSAGNFSSCTLPEAKMQQANVPPASVPFQVVSW